MNCCRIMIADDHALFRQGLRKIIEGAGELDIIGEAGNGEELLSLLETLAPQLIILDLSMPHMGGIQALYAIRSKYPEIKVLVLTMYREFLRQALFAGAHGYLLKEDTALELSSAISSIIQGNTYLSPRIASELLMKSRRSSETLSVREKQVLKLIGEGNSNKQIAEFLHISIRTVERHRGHIMSKLALTSTPALVKYAIQHGYITLHSPQDESVITSPSEHHEGNIGRHGKDYFTP